MPFVHVSSNVPKASVNVPATLAALSKAASAALGKPEEYVMVKLDLDQDMVFQTQDTPNAFIHIRSIGSVGPEINLKTAQSLTEAVSEALKLPANRIYMIVDDVKGSNWALAGKTY
ncbi:hypothetical protein PHYPSEUDO_003729 [Phytophthora pseudosyringae]|uniref:Uncharacterized protein n=1 Tax=Phytophthora pseudosyringae TaxID=221518 RepID=A0A8T1VTB8_9STRA|nr:hypothetical protein PHYPSEUDO_003729 [Phytophthora pseudosyringae]